MPCAERRMKMGRNAASGRAVKAVSSKLKTSVLAAIFTSYRANEKPSLMATKFGAKVLAPAFRAISNQIEYSRTSWAAKKLSGLLLSLKLRVFGMFLASFGVYTALFAILKNFILGGDRIVTDIIFGTVIAIASLPIVTSDETLSSALISSRLGALIRGVTGIRAEEMRTDGARGRSTHGFLAGLAAGIISYFVSPAALASAMGIALLTWIVLKSPEFGVIVLAFALPLSSVKFLEYAVILTALSFAIKIVRGKRFVSFETLDAAVFGILLVIVFGMIAPYFESSAASAKVMALFVAAYFLAANLMHSAKWVAKASSALVTGAVVASAALIAIKVPGYLGIADMSGMAQIFGDSLLAFRAGGADPASFNMIVTASFPIALSRFVKPPEGKGRAVAALSMLLMLFPLFEYRSVFAVLSVAAASMALLTMYSVKFLWLPAATGVLIAGGAFLLPAFADRVATFFGAGFDSFTGVRSFAWSDAADVLSRSFLGGVGVGPEAYGAVSSAHIAGVSAAGHSYNTYLQIWIGCGIVGFVLFILLIWFLITASFSSFDMLDRAKTSGKLALILPKSPGGGDAAAEDFSLSGRMIIAGPLCSVIGLLIYAAGDYIFADLRVFLALWIACGLTAAGVRGARRRTAELDAPCDSQSAVMSD